MKKVLDFIESGVPYCTETWYDGLTPQLYYEGEMIIMDNKVFIRDWALDDECYNVIVINVEDFNNNYYGIYSDNYGDYDCMIYSDDTEFETFFIDSSFFIKSELWGDINVKGWQVRFNGDESVGIFDGIWNIEGEMYFDSNKDKEEFRKKVKEAFSYCADESGLVVQTYEEVEREIRREDEYLAKF